ncbi:MAG: CPBP family intramembrane glutamic endopeptidase [Terracidiphilus sp.]
MNMSHGFFDYLLFALLLAVPAIERWWTWPLYLERLKTGGPGVRAGFYRTLIVEEWIPAVCLLGWWVWKARPWSGLLLAGSPTPWKMGVAPGMRLWAGLAYGSLMIVLMVMQKKALLAKPERMERARKALAYAEPLLPHTELERRLFWGVSLTAGVTEELFYRGFLVWFLMAWMGPLWAVLASSAIFGAGHIYMGWAQAPKTAVVGLVLAFVALASASLWPAILLHAAMDWNSGELGYKALGRTASSF